MLTVTLSDGTVATMRRARGNDLVKAQEIANSENKYKFACAMLAQVTLLDGEPCVMEDIMDLWVDDIDRLSQEATKIGGFLPSTPSSSPSSSNGGSG